MKKHFTKKNIAIAAVLAVILAVVLALAVKIADRDDSEEDFIVGEVTASPEPEETPQPDEEEVIYPAPGYDFKTDEIFVEIAGLKEEYTIAFVNDVHLITDHESGDVTEDNMAVVRERYETLSVTPEGIHAEDLWPQVVDYLNYNDFDAVIFGGDLLDYCSNSNIVALKSGLSRLKYPDDRIMYIRSDHDYGGWYGGSGFTDTDGFMLQSLVLDGDKQNKAIEFDDFIIVGINQSYRSFPESTYDFVAEKLDQGKPVLIATHVPFYSDVDESLEELSIQVRNRVYYWNGDGPIYVPDGTTQALIDRIYAEDSNVVQIVAAHMHSAWDGYVTERLKEHIFAPTFQGNIGIIHVTGGSGQNEDRVGTEETE